MDEEVAVRTVDMPCDLVAAEAPVPVVSAVPEAEEVSLPWAALLPASELAVDEAPELASEAPSPVVAAEGETPAAVVGESVAWAVVGAGAAVPSGVVFAAAVVVAGAAAAVVGGRVVAKLEVDWTLTQSRS